MLRKLLAILLVFALVGLFVGGCGDKDDSPKSIDEYRQDAEKAIDESNAEAELAKIQKEVEAEIKADTE